MRTRNATDHLQAPDARREAWDSLSLTVLSRNPPADASISDFWKYTHAHRGLGIYGNIG